MVFERLSNALSAAKKAWQEPKIDDKVPAITDTVEQVLVSNYYVDTLSKVGEELPTVGNAQPANTQLTTAAIYKGKVEYHLDKLSKQFDLELRLEDGRDYDRLQSQIYAIIMCMMRMAAKADQENIYEISLKIKTQAHEIQATYNTWQGLTITVISASVSIAGGVAGLAPFFPAALISEGGAKALAYASQGIGTAGTGLSGLGSIFNNKSEGTRQVLQIYLKRSQDAEEERKGSKQNKGQLINTAKAAAEEFNRSRHEAHRAATAT